MEIFDEERFLSVNNLSREYLEDLKLIYQDYISVIDELGKGPIRYWYWALALLHFRTKARLKAA